MKHRGWIGAAAAGMLLAAAPAAAQDAKKAAADEKALQMKVDAALKRGAEYLKGQVKTADRHFKIGPMCPNELVLLALKHAGVPEGDADFQKLLAPMLAAELQSTYCVSLQAMVLEEVGKVKHQTRIAQCAQFLVDNQCKNGQWSYGKPTIFPEFKKSGSRILIARARDGGDEGDHSNSQYAALGLRACHEAGIAFPMEVVDLAMKAWRNAQKTPDPKDPYKSAGWDYGPRPTEAYGSMTAGAAGALVIYDYLKEGKLSWLRDKDVQEGVQWMARNFSVTLNPGFPGPSQKWALYYLYAVERLGMLYRTERFGTRFWYAEGAKFLLDHQKPDGSWWVDTAEGGPITDTSFAILFLRRSTRPIVDIPSVDRFAEKK